MSGVMSGLCGTFPHKRIGNPIARAPSDLATRNGAAVAFSGSDPEHREALRKLRENDPPTGIERIVASFIDVAVPRGDWHGGHPCVYFIRAASGGPVKIGKSTEGGLCRRLRELQAGNPEPLVFSRIVLDDGFLERRLHEALVEYRITREWFAYEGPVVAACSSLLSPDLLRVEEPRKTWRVPQRVEPNLIPRRAGRPSRRDSEARAQRFAQLVADGDLDIRESAKLAGVDAGRALDLLSDDDFCAVVLALGGTLHWRVAA